MDLSKLSSPPGARRPRKRIGRGNASGTGTYSGKGLKGQKARSGPGPYLGFEGGQLPIIQRFTRKRGFTNIFRVEYEWVNVGQLSELPAGTVVTQELLLSTGVIKHDKKPLKVLGDGELKQALTVRAHRFTESAREKIEAAGGSVQTIEEVPGGPAADVNIG